MTTLSKFIIGSDFVGTTMDRMVGSRFAKIITIPTKVAQITNKTAQASCRMIPVGPRRVAWALILNFWSSSFVFGRAELLKSSFGQLG